jgi:hypothetical protein
MKTNYYFEKYQDVNQGYFEMLKEVETNAEKKSLMQRIIEDIKKQEYPKGQTKEIIKYLKTL